MSPKIMTLNLEDRTSPNNIIYTGKSPLVADNDDDVSIACNNSTLRVNLSQTGGSCVEYCFLMDNVAGLLMKKVFLRLKKYLDKSIHNAC